MEGHKCYIPILKWKSAEQSALSHLNPDDKINMTPLIQFVMPKPTSSKKRQVPDNPEKKLNYIIDLFEKNIEEMPEQIKKYWGTDSIFIDFTLLYTTPLKIKTLVGIMDGGNNIGCKYIPVLNFSDEENLKKAIINTSRKYDSGFCLRISCSDLDDLEKLDGAIEEFLKNNQLKRSDIDLLIDIKELENFPGKYKEYFYLSQKIKKLLEWRRFIFAGGAFPKTLSGCKIDEDNYIPRIEWQEWIKILRSKEFTRMPCFSDYTVQHPVYEESYQFFPPTTSIKYTLDNDWLIMKGQVQKFELFLANAKTLHGEKIYKGENFSYGDKYIAEKAKHFDEYIKNPSIKGTGSILTWLTACINHHLVHTIKQIDSLS